MKYIEEYLKDVIKIKPLGELTTKEDELNGMSGEMVYINDKCTDIFISHADYANWLEKQGQVKEIINKPWGEYDRTMAFTLMRDVDQMSYISKEGKNERIGWLNSLDEKFASTESTWSEEDKKIRETLIGYFKDYKTQEEIGIKTFFGIPTDDIIAWLEKQGQRPQTTWKPSKEQMTALSEASGIVGMFTPRGTNLQSLYKDLKKLKG